jgi:hypothetical protein
MKQKKARPTYGNSQGAQPDILNVDRNGKNKSTLPEQKYAQSHKSADRKYLQLKSDSTSIYSLPRTMFKLAIFGLITVGLLTQTKIGKSITAKFLANLATGQKTTQSTLDLNKAKERKQKAFDDRWDNAWEKAGGKPDKEHK